MGNSFSSILTYPGLALWRGHSSFALQRQQNTGSSSLPVISLHSVGVESDAMGGEGGGGYFRRWERSSYLTGQSPASKVLPRHDPLASLGAWGLG